MTGRLPATLSKGPLSTRHLPESSGSRSHLSDFSAGPRTIPIALIAACVGVLCPGVSFALLRLIAFFTNLFYFGRFSPGAVSPADHHLGAWSVLVPVAGG